jgi:hypothetical protein
MKYEIIYLPLVYEDIRLEIQKFGMRGKRDKEKDVLATKEDLANVKSDIIKWMFIFWIGQKAVTLGIIYFRS